MERDGEDILGVALRRLIPCGAGCDGFIMKLGTDGSGSLGTRVPEKNHRRAIALMDVAIDGHRGANLPSRCMQRMATATSWIMQKPSP